MPDVSSQIVHSQSPPLSQLYSNTSANVEGAFLQRHGEGGVVTGAISAEALRKSSSRSHVLVFGV